jgi:dTMP kinase
VKEYLRGKFGPLNQVDPKFAARLYAEDRLEAKPILLKWLSDGVNIILDRYIESNMAHQGGKFKGKERDEMIQWIYDLELNQLDLPKADLVIYLDLPVEWQVKAMDKEGRDKDLHESSIQHLLDAEETYKMLAERNKNWVRIDCLRNGRRLSPEELSDVVWKVVEPMLAK